MKILIMVFIFTFALNGAGLKNENLLQVIPKNYKLGYKNYNQKTHIRLLEFIPKDEKRDNWSEMITTTIFHKNLKLDAKEYIQKVKQIWTSNCKGSQTKDLPVGVENGYKFALVMLYCPKSKVTKREELTWIKAIKGKDSFYSIQKSFSHDIKKEKVIGTMKYLRSIMVCDSRLNNCPKAK